MDALQSGPLLESFVATLTCHQRCMPAHFSSVCPHMCSSLLLRHKCAQARALPCPPPPPTPPHSPFNPPTPTHLTHWALQGQAWISTSAVSTSSTRQPGLKPLDPPPPSLPPSPPCHLNITDSPTPPQHKEKVRGAAAGAKELWSQGQVSGQDCGGDVQERTARVQQRAQCQELCGVHLCA